MKPFSRQEVYIILGIIFLTIAVSFQNFKVSLRRARDAQRKGDIRDIYNALNVYMSDFGFYPLSTEDGKIIACERETIDEEKATSIILEERLLATMEPCEWGVDSFKDFTDPDYPAYLATLPRDPNWEEGVSYHYVSNTRIFQIFASLEGEDEAEYSLPILERKIVCGERFCNFGRAPGGIPLDKSLEEYENDISR